MCPSPLRIGRPPRFSTVHAPCREYCRALVQAFCIWLARIEQCRQSSSERNRKVFPKPVHPLPQPAVWLNILVQAGAGPAWAKHQSQQRTAKKQAWSKNDLPAAMLLNVRSFSQSIPTENNSVPFYSVLKCSVWECCYCVGGPQILNLTQSRASHLFW